MGWDELGWAKLRAGKMRWVGMMMGGFQVEGSDDDDGTK
jgi:hypothetical protein